MISSTHNLRFSSRIEFLPYGRFHELPIRQLKADGLHAGPPWTTQETVSMAEEAYTDKAFDCNAGGIQNGQHLSLFHLDPKKIYFSRPNGLRQRMNQDSIEDVVEAMEAEVKKLKKENPDLRALLTGGQAIGKSLWLKDALLALFKRLDIPVSIFWGQDFGPTAVHYDTETDTWSIHSEFNSSGIAVEDEDMLRENFNHIKIDPGDEVFINGKKVSPDAIEHPPQKLKKLREPLRISQR